MRSRFRQFRGGTAVLAVILGAAIGAPIIVTHVVTGGGTPPPPGTAVLWVSTTGGTCTRSATAASFNPSTSCGTPQAAYAKASLGDTVLMQGGTYTTGWNFTAASSKTGTSGTCNWNYYNSQQGSGTPNLTNCITFTPAPSQTVTLQVSGTAINQITACANFVRIVGITIAETTYTEAATGDTLSNTSLAAGSGGSTCLPGGNPPHDDLFQNIQWGGQAGIVGGATNFYIVGGTAVQTNDLPWQLGSRGNVCTGCIATAPVNHSGIVGVDFHGYSFVSDDSAHHHMECIHMDFWGDSNSVAGNKFDGCPVEGIRMEAESNNGIVGQQTNHLIENNMFDSGAPSGLFNPDCHDNGCLLSGNVVRFNTFVNGGFSPQIDCALNGANNCAGATGNRFYGNVVNAGCPSNASQFGGTAWTTDHDVFAGTQSGICTGDSTSLYSRMLSFVSSGSPTYDDHLAVGASPADNAVPTSVAGGCPAVDFDGVSRPQGANCDAGADER